MYHAFVCPVVADPLARAVAPITALHSTRTRKVPAIVSRRGIDIHLHRVVEVLGICNGRLSAGCRNGAEAGDGDRRVVGGALAFAAHFVLLWWMVWVMKDV
jgi:hypothetical protein